MGIKQKHAVPTRIKDKQAQDACLQLVCCGWPVVLKIQP